MTDKIKFELKGIKELSRNLDKLSRELDSFKEQSVAFSELFPAFFMNKYTQFNTIDEMVEKSPFKVESKQDFEKIPDDDWNIYVKETTSFQSWDEMMSKAGEEYLGKRVNQTFGKVFKK